MDIKALRNSRNKNYDKIVEGIKDQTSKSYEDKRFWTPTSDKSGNASAVIRFLPTAEGDELPWVRIWSHSFKNPKNGRWYIENCRSTLGEADPVNEYNSALWEDGTEASKKIASAQKRKLQFISNIYVVSDPKNPDNEGKVFLFKYGKTIFDMITAKIEPKYEDDKPVFVFDLWEGANFKFRKTIKADWPNYDDSSFDTPSELLGGDEDALLEVVNQQYKLAEFIDPKNFKSYDELKKKLDYVLGKTGGPVQRTAEDVDVDDAPAAENRPSRAAAAKQTEPAGDTVDTETEDYFRSLAAGDTKTTGTSGFDDFDDDIPF